MSAFAPELPPHTRLPHGEMLGRFVPTALRRIPPVARFVHPIRLAFIGFFTAGIVPCRMLQRRVNRVRLMYAHQAELAGELLVLHAPPEDAKLLKESADRVRTSPLLWRLSVLSLWAAIACAVVYLSQHGWRSGAIREIWVHPFRYDGPWVQAFVGLIGCAYFFLILQLNRQIAAMQQLAIAVNGVFESQPPIASPPLVFLGRSPLTLLLGLILAWFGLIWALPMAVAWSAFSYAVKHSAYGFRIDLSERLQAISGVTPVIESRDLCPNPHCRHVIARGAAFCSRCGTPIDQGAKV